VNSEINIPSDEWGNWTELFSKLFPTAHEGWIEQMTRRMIRTLSFAGRTTRMTGREYEQHLVQFANSLKELPPGSIQGGGEG
jgi:hypothetical protein